MLVTTGRIQESYIDVGHVCQVCCCVTAIYRSGMVQYVEVVLSQRAELGILLNVDTLFELLRHPVEVDTKASCQIHKAITTPSQHGLVAGCLFARALLHIEMWRIENVVYRSP